MRNSYRNSGEGEQNEGGAGNLNWGGCNAHRFTTPDGRKWVIEIPTT